MDGTSRLVVDAEGGDTFEFLGDRVSIKTAAVDTGGQYSLMHWTFGPNANAVPHYHESYEEVFYLLDGRLRFILGEDEIEASSGDLVRIPPNTRHGVQNLSSSPVQTMVLFTPGGIEELFRTHKTDGNQRLDLARYLEEAAHAHRTHYEIPTPEAEAPAV